MGPRGQIRIKSTPARVCPKSGLYPPGYFVSSRYCVQRIPDKTCHVTRVCYSGGLTTSFCEKGLCMCKFGYKYEGEGDDATCVEASEMLLAANTTEDLAFIKQQENAVAFNVFMFVAWISGFVAAAA